MIDRDRNHRKTNWPLTVAIVLWSLLACGLVISLAMRKIAVEEKVEQKFWTEKNMPKPTPKFVPFEEHE